MSDEVKVEIVCENESRVVGSIVVNNSGKKGFLLSSRVVWAGFQPVTEEYRLPRKMMGDGHLLRCPRCQGMLCIRGDNDTMKEETDDLVAKRDEARRRIVEQATLDDDVHMHVDARGIDPAIVPITLGKTRIEAS